MQSDRILIKICFKHASVLRIIDSLFIKVCLKWNYPNLKAGKLWTLILPPLNPKGFVLVSLHLSLFLKVPEILLNDAIKEVVYNDIKKLRPNIFGKIIFNLTQLVLEIFSPHG